MLTCTDISIQLVPFSGHKAGPPFTESFTASGAWNLSWMPQKKIKPNFSPPNFLSIAINIFHVKI